MSKLPRRSIAGLAAGALGLSGAVVATVAPTAAFAVDCVAPNTVELLSFNDFHGRVQGAAALFTIVEQIRAEAGEDNVLLTSNGDSIGGSTFVSAVADDLPTLDVLNAAGVEVSATGNHEYDKGWTDLSGRVVAASDFPYLAANVYDAGTAETTANVADPLQAYEVFEKGGVTIAVVGAVTGDLPSLVSPAGISALSIGDPVEAVNRVAAELSDGDEANGEADIVVATIHEGAPDGGSDAATNAAASSNFASIYGDISTDVDVVFNGHTHQQYVWETASGQPLLQADAYAGGIARVTLSVDADTGELCETAASYVEAPEAGDASFARIAEINSIVEAAVAAAAEAGAEVIGNATEAISTAGDGDASTRDQESPMSNMVAQMFFDMMSNGDDEFIGVQNPGGTRDSFDAGEITYEEAALVLPFANSLFTTQLTGEQFKTVLEQQWQRNAEGEVPSRPYLALGLSDNVSYTYDETLPEGERITGIYINGAPIDMDKLYTFGSGSFLISGGDNFRVFAEGVNTRDAGLVDLTAWVDWIGAQGDLAPDYTKRGVSVTEAATEIKVGESGSFTLGVAVEGGVNPGTLDMFLNTGDKVSPQLPNTSVTAYIGDVEVGSADVTDGVATVEVTIPATGVAVGDTWIRFVVSDSGTEVLVPVSVLAGDVVDDGDDDDDDDNGGGGPRPGLPSTGN
ncbi:bifunctional metallophosphatase/5'-nucleotidase [Tessaracoccus oleiagri]|uniref:5'-nucleotidase n=1 Tax=Tessaracoccus oleiagri TaxID=686624 RepID=A0A1G9HI25_9ACTN|nr:5'-nucleotidase C-terminal domain-containing protein [Tessaracoccus oleiagri]SDL12559.1 5'-nucleotidase [Tessaracoccus oleiagri]